MTVTTDVPCSSISNAIISLSLPNDPPASGSQVVAVCANGSFGTAVYHPDGSTSNDLVTVVATVDGTDPTACFSAQGPGCIVAKKLAPVAYQTNVSIVLQSACAGLVCGPGLTCNAGTCVAP